MNVVFELIEGPLKIIPIHNNNYACSQLSVVCKDMLFECDQVFITNSSSSLSIVASQVYTPSSVLNCMGLKTN